MPEDNFYLNTQINPNVHFKASAKYVVLGRFRTETSSAFFLRGRSHWFKFLPRTKQPQSPGRAEALVGSAVSQSWGKLTQGKLNVCVKLWDVFGDKAWLGGLRKIGRMDNFDPKFFICCFGDMEFI